MMPSKNKSSNLLMKFLPLKETINKAESPVQLDDRNHHDDGARRKHQEAMKWAGKIYSSVAICMTIWTAFHKRL